MREVAPRIEAEADEVVERLVARGRFDAVTELAEYLPMTVVSDLVGLPDQGREKMLEWAAAIWNTQGPADERAAAAGPVVEEFMGFAFNDAVPGKIDPDGWAAQLYDAADRGEIPRDKCPVMMLDYVTPSLDTTILAIANTIALFAENPDQWDLLRSDRSWIPHAINESLRIESPVPQFSRVLTEDHEIGGVPLAAGARVALLFGSANRDERHYPDPDRFDITRRPSDQLAFGRGEHVCVGIHLARLEMGALLERLADRVAHFAITDRQPMINNGLRGYDRLDVEIEPVV
ncbi:cytochrome P450 [Pseudonocardia phyllosphaerae]|uniref:cytochrome P450 n=1 Tax=Pseudonocardia phyllosphaerae TaxID=3390502 RepID=UPI003977EB0E